MHHAPALVGGQCNAMKQERMQRSTKSDVYLYLDGSLSRANRRGLDRVDLGPQISFIGENSLSPSRCDHATVMLGGRSSRSKEAI